MCAVLDADQYATVLRRTDMKETCHRIFYNMLIWSLTSFSKSFLYYIWLTGTGTGSDLLLKYEMSRSM